MTSSETDDLNELIVSKITPETPSIRTFELVASNGSPIDRFEAGAHVLVKTPKGLTRNYSLCNSPAEAHRYLIAVKLEENSRGGSRSMFQDVKVGSRLFVSSPRNLFALPRAPAKLILVAGGIGITPIMAMVHALRARDVEFSLYYCTRSVLDTAFHRFLCELSSEHAITFHHDQGNVSKALAFGPLFRDWEEGLDLYCCGPHGLMSAVREATSHWPAAALHFEDFQPSEVTSTVNRAFTVTIGSTGDTYAVPSDKTILQVLNENGFDVWSSCEQGTCATCKTRLIAGVADHRDRVLDDEERQRFLTVCVSRAISDNLVIEPE